MKSFNIHLIAVFCFLFGGTILVASTFVTEESDIFYGKGVHAFFDRNYAEAVKILLEVEKLDSVDPRPYYFLGLAYLRQEKTERADHYFERAAQLEYSGRAMRDYAVSESLRRIQGTERQRLEKIRATERGNAGQREQRHLEIRYGNENAAGRAVLRQTVPSNRKEDLEVLQKIAESFGGNVFDAKAIDPTNSSERIPAAQRTGSFDGVFTNSDMSTGRASVPARRQEKSQDGVLPTVTALAPTTAGGVDDELSAPSSNETDAPAIVTMVPKNGATDVDAETVTALRVTFNVDMDTTSSTWLSVPETFPKTTAELKWINARTCELPIELDSGREYVFRINLPNRLGFRSKEGVPVQPLFYKFSTR